MNHSTSMNPMKIPGILLACVMASGTAFAGPNFSQWSNAVPAPDTDNSVNGGCPIESPDGLTLYMASARPGGEGMLDIWSAERSDIDQPFGLAENLGTVINTAFDDFCPTPLTGKYFLFVSARPGGCGMGDIYISRNHPAHGWEQPVNLGCAESGDGPNTAGAEFSPSLVETDEGVFLFYSSTGSGNHEIYMSQLHSDGSFGAGVPVDELNTGSDDRMPNVSKNGLEIVFSSNRATWGDGQAALGGQDVYAATRSSTSEPWSDPVNLGAGINTAADETRSTLSRDMTRLYFGRSGEIYLSHRTKQRGSD
ncbi:MAG TPA: hypothetical protein VFG52_07315 [Xanthomonadales bacterium]|nr:hypothetical protein [Xanthomonadales bacterium]